MIASIVTLFMIPITLVNQAVVRFGLKAIDVEIDCRKWPDLGTRKKVANLGGDNLLGIAGTDARLHQGGGIHVELEPRPASRKQVSLKIGRNVYHEGELAGVHQTLDVLPDNRPRLFKIRRQKGLREIRSRSQG